MTAISATGSAVRGRHATARSGSGFTLVELLAVLLIMTLLAVIIPVSLQRMMPGRQLTGAKETLIANLRDLQSGAIASGMKAELLVERTGYLKRAGHTAKEGRIELPAGVEMSALGGPHSGPMTGIAFFEDGSSTGGRLELRYEMRVARLSISRVTGRISEE